MMTEEFKPKRPKTGGRQKGSKNKATIARENAIAEALRTIKNANGSGVFDGDAHALLMLVYKNENLPLDVRTRAAEAALKFERPALAAIDSRAETTVNYIVRMPEPVRDMDHWLQVYGDTPKLTDASDAEWNERLERIKLSAPKKEPEQ